MSVKVLGMIKNENFWDIFSAVPLKQFTKRWQRRPKYIMVLLPYMHHLLSPSTYFLRNWGGLVKSSDCASLYTMFVVIYSKAYIIIFYLLMCMIFRALSSVGLASTSFPLTGDQQTDADILAFIKARQNMLARTGISFTHWPNWNWNAKTI